MLAAALNMLLLREITYILCCWCKTLKIFWAVEYVTAQYVCRLLKL